MDEDQVVFPEYSKEDLDRAFEEALAAAKRLHTKIAALAEDTGYMVNVISATKPELDGLFEKAQTDPSAYPIVASGIEYLRGLTGELNGLDESAKKLVFQFRPTVNSTGTFASSTDSGMALLNATYTTPPVLLPPNRKFREHYSAKLKGLNPTLANSYNEVWQTYLGTSSEPHRAALFMMRTLFDNFFVWLGPDEEVRKSKHWRKKESDKPNQIWRSERLAFALEKHVENNSRRAILEAESKQIGAIYEAANEAHSRGSLDEDKASRTLMAMDSFLKDWIDSLK